VRLALVKEREPPFGAGFCGANGGWSFTLNFWFFFFKKKEQ